MKYHARRRSVFVLTDFIVKYTQYIRSRDII